MDPTAPAPAPPSAPPKPKLLKSMNVTADGSTNEEVSLAPKKQRPASAGRKAKTKARRKDPAPDPKPTKAAKPKRRVGGSASGAQKVDALSPAEARKRVSEIYKLEEQVERKRTAYLKAKAVTKSKKQELAEAEEALEREIREQRLGPGPLFEGVEPEA